MIALARRRLSGFPRDRLKVFVGDAVKIDAEDGMFDAVFDFAIIHHIPEWRKAIGEVVRVLRPGGRFFFEEVTQQALSRWFYRKFLDHPKLDRFSAREFVEELQEQGIMVGENTQEWFFGDFVVGVGYKATRRLV
jgi:ubiquinone/menaquinone biosynthesis C-methylase UbiE